MKKISFIAVIAQCLGVLLVLCPMQAEAVPGYNLELIGNGIPSAINIYGDIAANQNILEGGANLAQGWVSTDGGPPVYLPMPEGFNQNYVADLNDNGIAVGWVKGADFIQRAIVWFPNGAGDYEIFYLAGNLGPESTNSHAVAINNNDKISGISVEPLPGTLLRTARAFYYSDPEGVVRIDGFSNRPSDINDANVIVADNRLMDLNTNSIEDLGLLPDYPNPAGSHFLSVGYSFLNNSGSIVGRGTLATGLDNDAAIARYTNANGWEVLTIGNRYPAAYDINNNDDVTYQAAYSCFTTVVRLEGDGTYCLSSLLLDPGWTVGNTMAKINDDRQIATAASNLGLGQAGVVRLTLAGELPLPDSPTNLTATLQPESNLYPNGLIKVEWTNDNNVPVNIEVERNPGPNGKADFTISNLSGNGTDGIWSPLELNTTYTYRARACGLSGCSGYSNEASATTPSVPADTTPPVVSFISPLDGGQVSGNVGITANAVDNVAMQYIRVSFAPINGDSVICTAYQTETANCSWNTSNVQPGNYTLSALAVDHLGNYTTEVISVELIETTTGDKGNKGGKGGKGGGGKNGKGRKQ